MRKWVLSSSWMLCSPQERRALVDRGVLPEAFRGPSQPPHSRKSNAGDDNSINIVSHSITNHQSPGGLWDRWGTAKGVGAHDPRAGGGERQLEGGVQSLENCRSKPDGANVDQPTRGDIVVHIPSTSPLSSLKQGSTSDAEMLAEAAMLREHRNRLENRMVTFVLNNL